MASKTDAILLKIGADVSGASKGINDLKGQVGGLSNAVESGAQTLMRFAAVAVAGLGLKNAIANALEFGDAMTKMSQQTGMSTDAVQRLDFIASQTGTSIESIVGAVGKMQRAMVDSADGGKKLAEAIGYSHDQVVALFAMSPDEQFMTLAAEIAAISDPAEQTAAAMAAFGKSGAELLPTLKAIGEDAEGLSAAFDEVGGPVSADAIKALDDMGDAASRVGTATKSFAAELIALAAPAVIAAMDTVTAFFGGLRVLTGQGANEMVNLDNKILNLQDTLKRGNYISPFGTPEQNAKLKADLEAQLISLQEQYTKLANKGMEAAQAQIAARKAVIAMGPQELEDIIVMEKLKRETKLAEVDTTNAELLLQFQEWNKIVEEEGQAHAERMTQIEIAALDEQALWYAKSYSERAGIVAGELEGITAGVAQHNKVLFNINKAAGIANAIVSMHEGVAKSLATYPMPMAAVMAAVHAAAGLARVSAIASTQYQGGGKGAAPSQAGTPATPTVPAGNGNGGGGGGGGGQDTLRVQGLGPGDIFSGSMVRGLAAKLLEYQADGGRVVLEQ
jgi:hypothetical protein